MGNKLSKRAADTLALFNLHRYGTERRDPPRALVVLVALAAQNPGLEWDNYGGGSFTPEHHRASLAAYRSDARRCQAGMAAVRDAVCGMNWLDMTDDDFLAACADSGRVELTRRDDGSIAAHYCAGQYYPTEYRHAIARVIERAGEIAWQRRVAAEKVVA